MAMTTPIAMLRSRSSGRPSAESSAVAASVKAVKLATRPADDRVRPARISRRALPANTIGSTGSTQGEIAVTIPATKRDPDEQRHCGQSSHGF